MILFTVILVTLPLHVALRALGRKGFYNIHRTGLRIDGNYFYPPQVSYTWDINKAAFRHA